MLDWRTDLLPSANVLLVEKTMSRAWSHWSWSQVEFHETALRVFADMKLPAALCRICSTRGATKPHSTPTCNLPLSPRETSPPTDRHHFASQSELQLIIYDPYAQLKALELWGNVHVVAKCRWKMQGTVEEIPVMFFFVLKELHVLTVRSAFRCIGPITAVLSFLALAGGVCSFV